MRKYITGISSFFQAESVVMEVSVEALVEVSVEASAVVSAVVLM